MRLAVAVVCLGWCVVTTLAGTSTDRCFTERPVYKEVVGWVFLHLIGLVLLAVAALPMIIHVQDRGYGTALYVSVWSGLLGWAIGHWVRFAALNATLDEQGALGGMVVVGFALVWLTLTAPKMVSRVWRRSSLGWHGWQMTVATLMWFSLIVAVAMAAVDYQASLVIARSDGDGYCGPNNGHCGGAYTCWVERHQGNGACASYFCYVQAHAGPWLSVEADPWSWLESELFFSALSQGGGSVLLLWLSLVVALVDEAELRAEEEAKKAAERTTQASIDQLFHQPMVTPLPSAATWAAVPSDAWQTWTQTPGQDWRPSCFPATITVSGQILGVGQTRGNRVRIEGQVDFSQGQYQYRKTFISAESVRVYQHRGRIGVLDDHRLVWRGEFEEEDEVLEGLPGGRAVVVAPYPVPVASGTERPPTTNRPLF